MILPKKRRGIDIVDTAANFSKYYPHQCGTICGAIEGSRKSLKAIDMRVFMNFRHKYAVIFATKMPYLQVFATKIMFLNYMTKTQC